MANGPPREEVLALRALVEKFVQERLTPKLEDLDKKLAAIGDDDLGQRQEWEDKRVQLLDAFRPRAWLASAANRVSQIQLVTHALKYLHPNARGSNVYHASAETNATAPWVGTHSLAAGLADDVVGNAAALDVYKFLKLEHQGRTLLDYALARDPVLIAALSDDPAEGQAWVESLATITGGGAALASHKLARQVYFPLPDGGYHLLAPLFPTSLVHAVYGHLVETRFSEAAKAARQARRDGKPWDHGYGEYPHMAVLAHGGSKPQNVSQLNSERHGENWLLPSLPPTWQTRDIKPPLETKSVFRYWFGRRRRVRELSKGLTEFLVSTAYNNVHIRRARARMVDLLCAQVLRFAEELDQVEPGWTTDPECRLHPNEALWLDPGRALEDEEFAAQRELEDWRRDITERFATWLNEQLRRRSKGRLVPGDPEHAEWQHVLKPALQGLRKELDHV